jgi:spore maturation protein A
MNLVWCILVLASIILSFIFHTTENVAEAMITSSTHACRVFFQMATILVFWSGIFQIAIDSQLLKNLTKRLKKPLHFLFPDLAGDSEALEYICTNILANFFGLGSAATPFGLKAMQAMQKENPNKEEPMRSMMTLIVLNTSSFTLFPTTIFSLRASYGGSTSTILLLFMIGMTLISTCLALTYDRIFYYLCLRKRKT